MRDKDLPNEKFKEYIEEKIKEMQVVRETYPGWLLLPKAHEADMDTVSKDAVFLEYYYKRITDDTTKLHFLYELNWRLTISATPKNLDWIVNGIEDLAEHLATFSAEDKKLLLELRLSLLENYRNNGKNEKFFNLCDELLASKNIIPTRYIFYQQSLYYLSRYDNMGLKDVLTKWTVDIGDYQNCIQKANLLYYIGEELEAYQLLAKCKNVICKSLLQNREDIYAKSCLTYILKTMKWCDRKVEYTNADMDTDSDNIEKFAIGETLEELTEKLSGKAYEEKPVHGFIREHLFEIGDYNNSWNLGSSGFVADYLYPCKWWMLKERLGMSMFLMNQNFTKYCILKMFDYSWDMAWNMMMVSANSKIVESVFGREQLSQITEEKANELFDTYIALFEKADIQGRSWINNKVLNILPTVLGRLCTKVSQDRVLNFVEAALKWQPIFVNKILKCAYDCLNNDNLKVIWVLLLTEKKAATHYSSDGYTFPDRYMLNFAITNDMKKRIIDGLRSNKKEDVLQSMISLEVLWNRADLTDEDKSKISKAVREMRNGQNTISEAIYTYSYVDVSDEEHDTFQNRLDDEVQTFCETNYLFTNTSETFSQWHSVIEKINVLRKYLSDEQKRFVLLHCCDLIEQNKSSFEKDDRQDLLGGMRRFTQQIVKTYQSLFLNTAFDAWNGNEAEKIENQIDWLRSKGYRCLPMKVKALMHQQQNIGGDIIGAIKNSLFSKKQEVQVEGINAFFVLKDNGGDVSEILSYIFDNFRLADPAVYKELLILFINVIVRNYNENDFHQHVMIFLTSIHEDCENYGLDVCALSDLQHYTNYVAGALSEKTQIENIPVFSKEESDFNDVFVGFDKGVESVQHKNYQ